MFIKSSFVRLAACALVSLSCFACSAAADDDSTPASTEGAASEELVAKSARFETFEGLDGKVYFDLVAANGESVLRSQGYVSESAAKDGIRAVIAAATSNGFDVLEAKNGQYYFNVVAANGEIVGTSELYASRSNADRGADSVLAIASRFTARPSTRSAPKLERFESFVGADNQFYFHLRAGNGEILLVSEGYKTKASAEKGLASVLSNGGSASQYRYVATADGRYAVSLVAGNNEVIAQSQTYSTKSNATRAVSRMAQILAARNAAN